jgi:ribosome biogenesis GTPase
MTLTELGWRHDLVAEDAGLQLGETIGRVVAEHRTGYVVITSLGELSADVAGRLRHDVANGDAAGFPAVGDWVVCRSATGHGGGRSVITAVLARRGVFVRKEAGRGISGQVVAANVDFAFLATAFGFDLNPRRLERYVALALEGGVAPVIVITKADLATNREALAQADAVASNVAAGCPVHLVSAVSGLGLDDLGPYFENDRTVALIGSSGVGKSTLINRLLGRDEMAVQAVREDGRGRHTTTHRALIPRPGGGLMIDTPGMRELALWGGDEGVEAAFPEVESLALGCRFSDCSHRTEPGCAVQAAVRDGTLPAERLASFEKLSRELAHLETKTDRQAYLERKRRDKALNRAGYRWIAEKRW